MRVIQLANEFLSVLNPIGLWRSIFAVSYSSPDERFFVQEAISRRRIMNAEVASRVNIFYNLLMLGLLPFVALEPARSYLRYFHIGMIFLTSPIYFSPRKIQPIIEKVGFKIILPIAILLPSVAYYSAIYTFVPDLGGSRALLAINHVMLLNAFVLLVHPGSRFQRLLAVILFGVLGAFAFSKSSSPGIFTFINFVSALIGFLITLLFDRQHRAMAQREFRLLIQAAPAKIVRQSASSNTDIMNFFAPTERHCVCISSDWRGYQGISSSMATRKLSEALGAYYEMCERLLAKAFPEGNYYTDWIADELFVVVFAKDEREEKLLVNDALQFSHDLILEKKRFTDDFGFQMAIDIGVSSGVSLIGMMGPSSHRKATALGDVPGHSRRLQTAGKYIRQRCGDHDRVVFGSASLFELSAPFDVKEFVLDEKSQLRDLNQDRIFYFEPNQDESTAALERQAAV